MNTIKKLAFTLLIASATQFFASGSDPVDDIAEQAATRLSITSSDVQPFIQAAFDAGKKETKAVLTALDVLYKEEAQGHRSLLSAALKLIPDPNMFATSLRTALRTAVEEALCDVSQVDETVAVLTGANELTASNKIRTLIFDETITKNEDARRAIRFAYNMFSTAVNFGFATRA